MSKSSPHAERPFARRAIATIRTAMVALATCGPMAVALADEVQDVSKLVTAGRLIEAENRADAFLVKMPKDAQMRFLKGVILSQQGKRDEAIALFTGITQDYPELPEPYNNLAVIYAAQGEYDKARGALETSVRVSPRYATAHENLGDVHAALAARSYQDARRYDAGNASALRKLNAERALLTGSPAAAAIEPQTDAAPPDATRSQRSVGLPQPAGPAATIVGVGADAPQIVLPSTATSMPQRSNVVGFETSTSRPAVDRTSTLPGVTTTIAADPGQPIAEVTAAVQRWARARSVRADDLRIRVDGSTAVARFHEAALGKGKSAGANRVLTLRSDGAGWTVTDARTES